MSANPNYRTLSQGSSIEKEGNIRDLTGKGTTGLKEIGWIPYSVDS